MVKGNSSSMMWPSTESTRNLTLYGPAGSGFTPTDSRLGSSVSTAALARSTRLPFESITASEEKRASSFSLNQSWICVGALKSCARRGGMDFTSAACGKTIEGKANNPQSTKDQSQTINGGPFRAGNPVSPSRGIHQVRRRYFDNLEIPGKQLFLRSHLLYRHNKEPPVQSWEFPRIASANPSLEWNVPQATCFLEIPLPDGDR